MNRYEDTNLLKVRKPFIGMNGKYYLIVDKQFSKTVHLELDNMKYFLGAPETDDQQRIRFQVELEFVQCLANPNYLNCKFF